MADTQQTYLNNIDVVKMDKLMQETGINVRYFNNTCSEVVKSYSEGLDNLMKDLYVDCIKNEDAPLSTLESYYLELSNMIYFMQEKLEQLGVYADMSESASKEVFSKSYLAQSMIKDANGKSKSTVAELNAQASLDSQYESVVASIYERAYKIVKGKISSAQDTCNCLRKIITSRNNEMQLSMFSPRNGATSNED